MLDSDNELDKLDDAARFNALGAAALALNRAAVRTLEPYRNTLSPGSPEHTRVCAALDSFAAASSDVDDLCREAGRRARPETG